MSTARGFGCVVLCLVLVGGLAAGQGVRFGGALGASGALSPVAAADASLELAVGLACLDFSSWTEFSLVPYTIGSETVAVSCTRDWLGVRAEYRWSLIPIGITRAAFVARAMPDPWETVAADSVYSLRVEGEARLWGDSFAAALRTEIWGKATVGARRVVGCLDSAFVGASLETTLSAPGGGEVWVTPILIAEATLGRLTLRSETTLATAGGLRLDSETLSLEASWGEFGVSGRLWCTISEGQAGPSVGIRVAAELGDRPLQGLRTGGTCSGGVCR